MLRQVPLVLDRLEAAWRRAILKREKSGVRWDGRGRRWGGGGVCSTLPHTCTGVGWWSGMRRAGERRARQAGGGGGPRAGPSEGVGEKRVRERER